MRSKKNKKLSKAQCNKIVRTILLRHNIDLSKIHFSATNKFIYMSGTLLKSNGYDLPAHAILELVKELSEHGYIRSELQNWFLSEERISYIGKTDDGRKIAV